MIQLIYINKQLGYNWSNNKIQHQSLVNLSTMEPNLAASLPHISAGLKFAQPQVQGQGKKSHSNYTLCVPPSKKFFSSSLDKKQIQSSPQGSQEHLTKIMKKLYGIEDKFQAISIISTILDELDLEFSSREDLLHLAEILCIHLKYPLTQIAMSHQKANMLGSKDLKTLQNTFQKQDSKQGNQIQSQGVKHSIEEISYKRKKSKICKCCSLPEQIEELSIGTDLNQINNIGLSTHLFFFTIQAFIFLFMIFSLIFSVYTVTTNIMASVKYKNTVQASLKDKSLNSFYWLLSTSIGSKLFLKNQSQSIQFQCWLGLATVIVLGVALMLVKWKQRYVEGKVKYENISITNYALLFKNMPKQFTNQKLQQQLRKYLEEIRILSIPEFQKFLQDDLTICNTNITALQYLDETIYKDQKLKQVNQKYFNLREELVSWIKARQLTKEFPQAYDIRRQTIEKFAISKLQKLQEQNKFGEQTKQQYKIKHSQQNKRNVFVTFNHTYDKQILQRLHKRQSSFLYKLPCFDKRKYFQYTVGQNSFQIQIVPAPEPADINWSYLGRNTLKQGIINIATICLTLIILCISFAIFFALTTFQASFSLKNSKAQKSISDYLITQVISIIIPIINAFISFILRYLSGLQAIPRYSKEQASIGYKIVFATLINSIFIPLSVSIFYLGNIFGVDGLSDTVTSLALSNAFVTPIIKLINLGYLFNRLEFKWNSWPSNKLELNQMQLNILNQYPAFQIGVEYATVINIYIFTCFFASLQPIIVPISAFGLLCMFYTEKYNLFHKCKRPFPGDRSVNRKMSAFVFAGPLFYSLGSLLFTELAGKTLIDSLPNILSFVFSVIIFFFPYQLVADEITKGQIKIRDAYYISQKNFILQDYEQMNPSTHGMMQKHKIDLNKGQNLMISKQKQKGMTQQKNGNNNKFLSPQYSNSHQRMKFAKMFGDSLDGNQDQQPKFHRQENDDLLFKKVYGDYMKNDSQSQN